MKNFNAGFLDNSDQGLQGLFLALICPQGILVHDLAMSPDIFLFVVKPIPLFRSCQRTNHSSSAKP